MAEFNPYKLEEEKWTPNNVYEILPPNAVSWSDYDFGQGTDNVDRDAAEKSFIDGFVDFFKDLFGVAGQILGGALELGGAILGGFVEGVISFVGGIANAIGSIFGGGSSESPNLPLFNPIRTNLEALIQPQRDQINESLRRTEEILAEQLVLRGQMDESLEEMRDARDRANEAIEQSGKSIAEAEAATAAAEDARQKLEDYNTALNERITTEFNSAVGRANTAVDKADSLAQQLEDFKIQASADVEDALSKAQAANDELAALSPQIDEAVSNSSAAIDKADQTLADYTAWAADQKIRIDSAVSEAEEATANVQALSPQVADAVDKSAAATDKVATLTPQVSDAVAKAGAAVTKADQTLSEYTAWSKAQKTRIDSAVSKAEAATANVTALTPQVADAVAQSAAATDSVSTLTPQVSEAVAQAGAAFTKADQTLADYTAWATAQKSRIDTAVSKAETATANVATLTPKVTDAVSKANKATADVSTLTPKVTDAASKAAKASADVSALTPKVTAAQDKADKTASDLSTLTPKVTAAQSRADAAYTEAGKVRNEVTPKIEAAQTKGESALAVADQAIDWLSNPVDIGTSLLANIPGTETPAWIGSDGVHEIPKDDLPAGAYNGWYSDNVSAQSLPKLKISINPAFEYKVSGWTKREVIESTDPSAFLLHIRSDEDSNPIDVYDRKEGPGTWWSRNPYILSFRTTSAEWEPFEVSITFKENISKVWISAVTWSFVSTSHAQATNYVAGLRIEPVIPTQASVDQAQNDAIRANSEILRQQGEINEAQRVANLANNAFIDNQTKWNTASTNATKALADAAKAQTDINAEQAKFNTFQTEFNKDQTKWNAAVDRSLATQETVNDNFRKWTDGAATAIEANTKAIAALSAPESGASLMPANPLTNEPYYVSWAGTRMDLSTITGVSENVGVRCISTEQTRYSAKSDEYVLTKLNKGTVYRWSVWVYSSVEGSYIAFMFRDPKNGVSGKNPKGDKGVSVVNTSYGIYLNNLPKGWNKLSGTIEFQDAADYIYMYGIEWNKTNIDVVQYFAGLDIYPDVPSQAQVDAAQDKAIEAFDLFMENQDEWNAGVEAALETQETVDKNFKIWSDGATTAIEANTTAIKALTKPEIGSSLIALDADTREPHYMQWAGERRAPSSDVPFSYAVRNTSSVETRADAPGGQKVPVKLNSDLTYKWSVWIYSNKSNAEIRFLTTSDSIGLCVEKTTYQHTKKSSTSKWGIFVDGISTGWAKYEGTIKFLPGADNVHLYAVEWNKTSIPSTQLWFSQLDIVPDVPTQAQVDAAQDKAIEAFDLFMENQDEWNAGVEAALETQETVDKNFKIWTDGAAEAIAANTRALAIINAGKQGSNIIPVNPDSGRPWFAEPLQESTDHPPLTSGPTYYSPAAQTSVTTYGPFVEVDPKIKYTVSFWAKASKAGSVFYGQFRSQEGRTVTPQGEPLTKGGVTVANPPQPSNKDSNGNYVHSAAKNSYFVSNLKLNTTWTYYETEIQFNEGVTAVSILRMYWSHSNGIKADQYISGLSIRPQIPTQAQVDDAQNKAIESLGILTAKQKEWSDGAEKAIQANTDVAVALARINGIRVGGRNLLKKSYLNVSTTDYRLATVYLGDSVPEDGEEITFSVKGSLGAGKESFAFYNSGGNTFMGKVYASEKDSNGVYKLVTKWKSNSNNSYVNIYAPASSVTATSKIEWIKLERGNQASDWTPAPEDLPTQKQVDDAQNDAIKANTEALKALGKKALGASLVPYKTPSTQEVEDYAAGKLSYDPWADPEYFDAGYSIASNSTYGRYARAYSNQGSKFYNATHVSVDSSIEYRIKFDAYAAAEGSILVVAMQDQNGSTAVQSTSVRDAGTMGNTVYPIHYLTLKQGWNSYSGKIRFKPTTTAARFSTFYWNHSNGVSTTQCFTNLEIVPDIPSQAVVDELQDNAIRKNTQVGSDNKIAIEALRDGLNASIELETVNQIVGELEDDLSKEIEKRRTLQAEIDALQTEMIPRTIVSDDRVLYDDNITLSGTKVTAKGSWAGQLAITYQDRRGNGTDSYPYIYETKVTRKSVPDGTTRSWTFSRGIERVDYWVYRGRQRTILLANAGPYITGSSFTSGTYRALATHTVGKTYGTGKIEWRANLQFADRGVTYRFRIEVNGTAIKTYEWKGIGPLTPLGDGKRTLKFEHEFDLPDDATVRLLGYAYNSNSQQARVSLLQGTLVYVQDTAREAQ